MTHKLVSVRVRMDLWEIIERRIRSLRCKSDSSYFVGLAVVDIQKKSNETAKAVAMFKEPGWLQDAMVRRIIEQR